MLRKRKNKAQVQTQVFIYILTLVIVGMIVIFGYKAIASIKKDAERAEIVNLQRDLTSTINTMRSSYGSVKIKEFVLPGELKIFCVVDFTETAETVGGGAIPVYSLVQDAWSSNTANLFFLSESGQFEPFKVEDVVVDSGTSTINHFCITSKTGKIRIKLEGLGDSTRISQPE